MKSCLLVIALCFLFFGTGQSVDYKKSSNYSQSDQSVFLEQVSVDIDDGTIILTSREDDSTIEITENRDLYVNGNKVILTVEQQELVGQYYDTFMQIIESAKRVGLEGARIGLQGAALGVQALAGVVKLISPDYDQEDLEREIELKAKRIEKRAERLEKKASKIEYLADEFKLLHHRLVDEVPEIKELDTF
jgi:GTP1/Obg family GTP-binding protein